MSRRHSASTPQKDVAKDTTAADAVVPTIVVPKIGLSAGSEAQPAPQPVPDSVPQAMPETPPLAMAETAPEAAADPAPCGENKSDAACGTGSGRALAVYVLAVLLLALLEAGRLQTFLEQTELPGALQAAALVEDAARLSGATLVSNAESRLTRQLASQLAADTVIGTTVESGRSLAALAAATPATATPVFVPPSAPVADRVADTPVVAEGAVKASRHAATPKLLIVGDSLIMEGLGPVLHRTLRKRTDISVVREGRYSTGLTRTDTFNWPDHMRELVARHQPDIILVCLGANDSQDILVEGKRHIAGTPSWQELYRARADRFLAEATAQGATVIWLGLPIMGKPAYEKRIRLLSDLQEAACTAEPLCRFQNGMAPLADAAGNYLSFVLDANGQHVRLRYKDMVHVTEPGGQRLVDNAMPLIEQIIADVKSGAVPAVPPVPSTPTAPAVSPTPQVPTSPTPPVPLAPPVPLVPVPAVPTQTPPQPESPQNDVWDALLK